MTSLIPDYEVPAFLDTVAPGKNNTKIAEMVGAHRNTVARWQQDGMPVKVARMLIGFRLLEIQKHKAAITEMEAQLAPLIESYGV